MRLVSKMASLPSPSQVAGEHYDIYDAYYNQVDPQGVGMIAPLDAARFLKKSKLSDIVLGKIWDLSDPCSKGCLDKQGFFVALKLCALAQSGRGISMENISASEVPQPKMGEIPKLLNKSHVDPSGIDWSVNPAEKAKYDQLFDSLQPVNGVLPGKKVRGVLMESKLPVDMLGKIWDLADLDKDGSLSRHEFMIAMHLVYKALEKHAIPNILPLELQPTGRRKPSQTEMPMPLSRPPVPVQPASVISTPSQPIKPPLPPQPLIPAHTIVTQQPIVAPPQSLSPVWVVTAEEKTKYDHLFATTDADRDGFVSGLEIKDVFLKSGVQQNILAHIWSLCDPAQSGKLNNEQFALAMWLINRKMLGIHPPTVLTTEMVPPSLRTGQHDQLLQQESISLGPQSTPELDILASEIRDLTKERISLESDVAQKEAELRVKETEVRNLQSELDTLAATLRQLENQKGEAQKRLNDLKTQKSSVESELSDLIIEVEKEQEVVDKLSNQAAEQEASLRSQEDELSSKKQELEGLKQEEQRLEKLQEEAKITLDNLAKTLDESQSIINQVRGKVEQLEKSQRELTEAVATCEAAVAAGDASQVQDSALSIGPDHRAPDVAQMTEEPKPPSLFNGTADDKFHADFANGAFSNSNNFENTDPFGAAFEDTKPTADPFSAFGPAPAKADPFDPFVDGNSNNISKTPADAEDEDPFGCDPFANLHAPVRGPNGTVSVAAAPPRPTSPSPALPPKKAKQPPPRPAPPRPSAPPTRAAPVPPTPSPDPYAASSGFDHFANFDAKFGSTSIGLRPSGSISATPSPVPPTAPRYQAFEFTEDPFKNYRYEDVFSIDPFTDNSSSDPFSSDATPTDGFEARFPESDAFDADDPFGGDFAKADLLNGNKSDNSINIYNGNNADVKNSNEVSKKSFNVDPFMSVTKIDTTKPNVIHGNDSLFKNKLGLSGSKKLMSDDVELAWAATESLQLEKERRNREEQERLDLETAIALSKKENNAEKKTFSSLLRRNKNAFTT